MNHPDYVSLGSTILVSGADGERESYTVVPPNDADPRAGRVPSHSPIGRALLGRRVGESVVVPAPGGSFTLQIESVEAGGIQAVDREQA
jgi:transcription elongation factor GreA